MDLVDYDEEAFDAIVRDFSLAAASTSRDITLHPDQRAERRQRRRPLGERCPGTRAAAARAPRDRRHRARPRRGRAALPRAVGHPRRRHRLPRLRRPGRRRRAAPRRRGRRAAVGRAHDDRLDRHVRRAAGVRRGGPSRDDPPRRRRRRLARRPDLRARRRARARPRGRTPTSAGWPTCRCARAARYAIKHATTTARAIVDVVEDRLDVATLERHAGTGRARAQRHRPRDAAHVVARSRSTPTRATARPARSSSSTRRRTTRSARA